MKLRGGEAVPLERQVMPRNWRKEMTQNEFMNTGWNAGMRAIYKGEEYPIAACDFEEALIALDGATLGTNEPTWVRCENVTLVAA